MSLTLTTAAAIAAPMSLWLAGSIPDRFADRDGARLARLANGATWLAFGFALTTLALHGFGPAESFTLFAIGLPFDSGALALSIHVDAVTVIMLTLVALVGAIVSNYARNYMAGDAHEGRFHRRLLMTLASILTLIVSGNLLMFLGAWIATSLSLHRLLLFYPERPGAVLAAHKKFVFSRIGDLSLALAVLLVGATLHTLELSGIQAAMAALDGPLPASLQWAAWLVVLSAALKCAQFPFHGWLIQVMEAPTPVSALLHAGIVNAGAFLVIRFSPLMSVSGPALEALALIGLTTLTIASLVMLTQTSIKVSLAWSTSAQMGFMLLEAGLGLYSLALLHLVAHSLYKAHAFLAAGSSVDGFRAPTPQLVSTEPKPWHWLVAFQGALLMTLIAGWLFGIDPVQEPALIVTGAIVAVAVAQLLLQSLRLADDGALLVRASALGALVCLGYFALHAAFEWAIADSVRPVAASSGPLEPVLALAILAIFIGLILIQHLFSRLGTSWRQTIQVHLYNGLYVDVLVTRLILRLWPPRRTPVMA